jgi:hypothetical protein
MLPGLVAVGDVRAGNVTGVASAVGERSIPVSFVDLVLAGYPNAILFPDAVH